MEFDFSNCEVEENGKNYKVCNCCGKRCRTHAGYSIEYCGCGGQGRTVQGLCISCANRIIPVIEKCFEDTFKMEERIRKQKNYWGCLVEEILREDEADE